MQILTNFTTKGCLTSVTTPPRSYSEKAEVSPIVKEYGPVIVVTNDIEIAI